MSAVRWSARSWRAREFELAEPPEDGSNGAADEVTEIAEGLRSFERALGEASIDRVVLVGSSNRVLAALLVATKLRIPVAAIEGGGDGRSANQSTQANGRLIEHLADATVAENPSAIEAWLRDPQSGAQSQRGH